MKTSRLLAILLIALAFAGCKTTEVNYRAAYEKTMAARAEQDSIDSTIYGNIRRQSEQRTVDTPDGPVEVKAQLVRVTEGGGGLPQNLKRYNVVVGQFKQLFNARSLRERLADTGYPTAFVVETGEPFYYIVLQSFDNAADASASLKEFSKKKPITMKAPCPFILDASARRGKASGRAK